MAYLYPNSTCIGHMWGTPASAVASLLETTMQRLEVSHQHPALSRWSGAAWPPVPQPYPGSCDEENESDVTSSATLLVHNVFVLATTRCRTPLRVKAPQRQFLCLQLALHERRP